MLIGGGGGAVGGTFALPVLGTVGGGALGVIQGGIIGTAIGRLLGEGIVQLSKSSDGGRSGSKGGQQDESSDSQKKTKPDGEREAGGMKPGISIEKQLQGTGQLKDLKGNPNLKKVNIDNLLTKTPEQLKQMLKQGDIDKTTFKQITKAFEGRNLRKS